jgi:hypothetical protein
MEIIFKKDKKTNEVVAFMPYDFQTWEGMFTCYAHVGQHSRACYDYYLSCKPATEEEYKPLLEELQQIGYNVEIRKRINATKFRKAYQDFMEKYRVNEIKV